MPRQAKVSRCTSKCVASLGWIWPGGNRLAVKLVLMPPLHTSSAALHTHGKTRAHRHISLNNTCNAGRASSTAQCRSTDRVRGARSGVVRGHPRDVAGGVVDGETVLGNGGVVSIVAHQIHLRTHSICSGPQALAAKLQCSPRHTIALCSPSAGYQGQTHHTTRHASCKRTGYEGL